MPDPGLAKFLEHNNWANLQLVRACLRLAEEELDAKPWGSTSWSIREALSHLVESQRGYLSLLALPPEARSPAALPFADLEESVLTSGQRLLALSLEDGDKLVQTRIRTQDGYFVNGWVVLVQTINHASDHRRQICDLLRNLGLEVPRLDGWAFGEASGALVKIADGMA